MRIGSMDASATALADTQSTLIKEVREIPAKDAPPVTGAERKEAPVSEKAVIQAIEKANRAISDMRKRFEFSIHEGTKEIMVKVIDSGTNEVIREIPPEKILDMVAKMWEIAGIIVDERR